MLDFCFPPGSHHAQDTASDTSTALPRGALTRSRHRRAPPACFPRWCPSAIIQAANPSSPSCAKMGLSCRGSIPGQPFPRCVLTLAPAATACFISSALPQAVCPSDTRMPLPQAPPGPLLAVAEAINSRDPGSSGARVSFARVLPVAAFTSLKNPGQSLGVVQNSRAWAPR